MLQTITHVPISAARIKTVGRPLPKRLEPGQPRFSADMAPQKRTAPLLADRLKELDPQLESTSVKLPHELQVGMWSQHQKRRYNNIHRRIFAKISGDDNHLTIEPDMDHAFARWYRPLMAGFFVTGTLPVVNSNHKLLGRGIVMAKVHHLTFVAPVRVGDTVTSIVEIKAIQDAFVRLSDPKAPQPLTYPSKFVTIQSDIYANDRLASTGVMEVMLPKRQPDTASQALPSWRKLVSALTNRFKQ